MVISDLCWLEIISVLENNGKQNPDVSYFPCGYSSKLACVDDKFNKSFKSYLVGNAVYNFIARMIKESIYCGCVMKKH